MAGARRGASRAASAPLQVGVASLHGAALRFTLFLRCGAGGAARAASVWPLALIADASRAVARGRNRQRPAAARNPTQQRVAAPRNSAPRPLLNAWRGAGKAVNKRRGVAVPSAAARGMRSSDAPWRARASRATQGRPGRCGASAAGGRERAGARACRLAGCDARGAGGSGTRCWPRNGGRTGGAEWFSR